MSFKDELLRKVLETDSTSLDYTPTDYQDKNDVTLNSVNPNIYGISFNLDTSEFEDDDDDDDDDEMYQVFEEDDENNGESAEKEKWKKERQRRERVKRKIV